MDIQLIIKIVAVACLVWFLYSRFAGVKGLKTLNSDDFQQELKENPNALLVDVREPGEVKQGFIPGAVNIPLTQLNRRWGEIPRDKSVYLYCRSGMRSKQAARVLIRNGLRDVAHLQGGVAAWKGKLVEQ
ncbi:rhodanese-like domain-containing protein [Paenibacillus vulneris]|uniref:Rhodanese-like domain-containing protein n=1 Tax=Paenibacillus vulneris TaxID=1133364 RepID=A0ABW3UWF0_9BACL|nr:rhodanese-like domain-containing protein [Paenibacillus sp. 32352]